MEAKMNDMNSTLTELLDLHGANLDEWPDPDAAQQARMAALSDPAFRQQLEDARRLDRSFAALAGSVDSNPSVEARLAGMQAAVLAQVEPQAQRRRAFSSRSLMRLAASLILACGLGIGVGQIVPEQASGQPDVLDQLLLGTYQPSTDNGDG